MELESVNRELEFSRPSGEVSQSLLFHKTPFVYSDGNDELRLPPTFYEQGYATLAGIPSAEEAERAIYRLLGNLDRSRAPLIAPFIDRLQLAKVDRIPVCDDIVRTPFQALHFDMGQPIVSPSTQTLYLILGLYCPLNARPGTAHTRVVSIRQLLAQRQWGERRRLEENLLRYVRRFGDGWLLPKPVNTFRLACFARVLDAVSGEVELADEFDKTTGQWFRYDTQTDGEESLENEYRFYARHGLDLRRVEARIQLQPGELLIVDNSLAIHGRIGRRKAEEIYQFLFGVRSATPDEIDRYRAHLLRAFPSLP